MDYLVIYLLVCSYYCIVNPQITFILECFLFSYSYRYYCVFTTKNVKDILVLKASITKNELLIEEILKTLPPNVLENILNDCLKNDPELYTILIEILKGIYNKCFF